MTVDPDGRAPLKTLQPGLRWTTPAIVLKLAVAAWLVVLFNEHRAQPTFQFFQDSGDVANYVRPVESLLRSGHYTIDASDPMASVYRMPGYAFTFLPFRAMFDENTAKELLVGLQLLVECLALFCVGDVAGRLTGSVVAGIWALLLYAASTFVTIFSCMIVPDGLAANLTLILCWLLVRNAGGMGLGMLFAAGAMYIYLVFLRPFLAPLVIPFALVILMKRRAQPRRRALELLAFLAIPTLVESAWVVRNYVRVGEPIFFHLAGMRLPAPDAALRRWVISFGGDFVWWRPGSVMTWFTPESPFYDPAWLLPSAPLTRSCPLARVLEGRTHYVAYRSAVAGERESHGRLVMTIFDSCRAAYEEEKPFDHHVVARLRLIRAFLVHGGPPLPLPRFSALDRTHPRFWFKVASVGIYAATLVLGCYGLVILIVRPGLQRTFVASVTMYLLLVFPWGLRFVENRFLAAAYPFLAVAAGVACESIWKLLSLSRRAKEPNADPSTTPSPA